jgi:hypothetical protein
MYSDIGFEKFGLGLIIIALPAAILSSSGNSTWAWRYAALILIMYLVFNAEGMGRFAAFIQAELRR